MVHRVLVFALLPLSLLFAAAWALSHTEPRMRRDSNTLTNYWKWEGAGRVVTVWNQPGLLTTTLGFEWPSVTGRFRTGSHSVAGVRATWWVDAPMCVWRVEAPHWLLVTAFAVYPVSWLAGQSIRKSRRRRQGRCLTCGYDLTGNVSGVCPECGKPQMNADARR